MQGYYFILFFSTILDSCSSTSCILGDFFHARALTFPTIKCLFLKSNMLSKTPSLDWCSCTSFLLGTRPMHHLSFRATFFYRCFGVISVRSSCQGTQNLGFHINLHFLHQFLLHFLLSLHCTSGFSIWPPWVAKHSLGRNQVKLEHLNPAFCIGRLRKRKQLSNAWVKLGNLESCNVLQQAVTSQTLWQHRSYWYHQYLEVLCH